MANTNRRRNTRRGRPAVVVAIPRRTRQNRARAQQPRRRQVAQQGIVKTVKKQNNKVTKMGQILRTGGALLGSYFGAPGVGSSLGAGISRIFGQGDYTVESNSLASGGPPSFANVNSGIRIHHREFIQDVTSSIAFANTSWKITPTNSYLFPWLSRFAQNFEEYEFKGLAFYFNTTSGNAVSSTNNALGVVGMTTIYDPSKPPPSDKRQAEDYAGCVSGVPSSSLLHPIECAPRMNVLSRMYVQTIPITNVEDWKFYAVGALNLFTQGMQAAGITIGELWVTYDIEFYKPRILPLGTTGAVGGRLNFTNAVVPTNVNQICGSSDLNNAMGNLLISYKADGTVTIPAGTASGYYLFTWSAKFASSTITTNFNQTLTSGTTNIALVSTFIQTVVDGPGTADGSNIKCNEFIMLKNDNNEASFRIAFSALPTQPPSGDLCVVKVPYGLVMGGPEPIGRVLDSKEIPKVDVQSDLDIIIANKIQQLFDKQTLAKDSSFTEITDKK